MVSLKKFLPTKTQLVAFVLLVIALIAPALLNPDCPRGCTCSVQQEVHDDNTISIQHASCSSLKGLKLVGRTSTLQSLNLSHIGITKVTNQLDKLKNLTTIDLSFNRLSEVCKLNRRIKTLNLSHNRITSGKLSKIPLYIQHLNLSHNEITYLPLEFKKLRSLRTIELLGNPINCTCETLEVRNWLQENHVWTDNHVKFISPLHLKGRPWLQIGQADACGNRDDAPYIMLSAQPSLDYIDPLESINIGEFAKDSMIVRRKRNSDHITGKYGGGSSGNQIEIIYILLAILLMMLICLIINVFVSCGKSARLIINPVDDNNVVFTEVQGNYQREEHISPCAENEAVHPPASIAQYSPMYSRCVPKINLQSQTKDETTRCVTLAEDIN